MVEAYHPQASPHIFDGALLHDHLIMQERGAGHVAGAFMLSSGACPMLQTASQRLLCQPMASLHNFGLLEMGCCIKFPKPPMEPGHGQFTPAYLSLTRSQRAGPVHTQLIGSTRLRTPIGPVL